MILDPHYSDDNLVNTFYFNHILKTQFLLDQEELIRINWISLNLKHEFGSQKQAKICLWYGNLPPKIFKATISPFTEKGLKATTKMNTPDK